MKLHYFWTDLPDGSHVAVNYTVRAEGVSGSFRVWSRDTRVNIGRKFMVPAGEIHRDAGGHPEFRISGPRGEEFVIAIPEDAWLETTAA
jgi:hypothetical protein